MCPRREKMCATNLNVAGSANRSETTSATCSSWIQNKTASSAYEKLTSIPVCLALLAVLLPYSSIHVSWMLLYPLLALNALLLVTIAISYVSMEASIDTMAFAFQLVWSPISVLFSLKTNLLELKDEHFNHDNEKSQSLPKWVKQGIFFMLVQHSFLNAGVTGLEWFYTLLSYRLLANVTRESLTDAETTFVAPSKPETCQEAELQVDETEPPKLSRKAEVVMAAAAMATTVYYNDPAMTAMSLVYFLLSEDILNSLFTKVIESLQIDFMEGLELCYMEGFLLVVESVLSLSLISYLSIANFHWSVIPALYICLHQPVQNLRNNVLRKIKCESLCLAVFRRASQTELKSLNDVCAVCLGPMTSARVTDCNHIFHGKCLKQCLRKKPSCPMCNQRLLL